MKSWQYSLFFLFAMSASMSVTADDQPVSAADIQARHQEILGKPPRVEPLKPDEYTEEAVAAVTAIRAAIGAPPTADMPEYFATMLRHPELMQRQIELSIQLFNGALSARDRELAVLRTAWLSQAPYEWGEHVQAGKRQAGLTSEEIERVTAGSSATGWSEHDRAILRAVEELYADAMIADETWALLATYLDEKQLLELPVLMGAYLGVAYLQNSGRFRLEGENTGLMDR